MDAAGHGPATACPPDDPDDVRDRQLFALVTTTVILALSLTTYGLRIVARKKTGQLWKLDDLLMGIGLFVFLEPAICEYLLLPNGLGHHICNIPDDQRRRFAKISFALQRANQPALACVKISILVFYMRIFSTRAFRMAAYANIAFTIVWAVPTWIINLTVCAPIAYYYDKTIPGGSCRNQAISGSVSGGLSMIGDLAVLVLPLPMIWNLRINARKKAALAGIFMLGIFVCVASSIRLVELIKFVPADATYTQVYASTWTTLEQGVAVICGNLPALAPLFDGFFGARGSSARRRPYHYYEHRAGRKAKAYLSSGSRSRREEQDVESEGGRPVGWAEDAEAGTNGGGSGRAGSRTSVMAMGGAAVMAAGGGGERASGQASDLELQARDGTPTEIEMDDHAILVKTEVTVWEEDDVAGASTERGGFGRGGPARRSQTGWS